MRSRTQLVSVAAVAVALFVSSLALANDHGKKPPRDGCTFEGGRTVCIEVIRGDTIWYLTGRYFSNHRCQARDNWGNTWIGNWLGRDLVYETPVTTVTTTHFGNSHMVESEITVQTVEKQVEELYIREACL